MAETMEVLRAWFSIPVVQLCAVLFAALSVIVLIRSLKKAITGKPAHGK